MSSINQGESVEDLIEEIDFLDIEINVKVIGKCNKLVKRFSRQLQQYEDTHGDPQPEFYDQVLKGFKNSLEYGNELLHDYEKIMGKLPPERKNEYMRKYKNFMEEKEKLVKKFEELVTEQRKLRKETEELDLEQDWGLEIEEIDLEQQDAEDQEYVDRMMLLVGEEEEEEEGEDEDQKQAQLYDDEDEEDSADDYVMREMEIIVGKRELINEILSKLVKKSENIKKLAKECAEVVVAQNKKLDKIGAKLDRLDSATNQLQDETMRYLRTVGRTKALLVCATCVVFLGFLVAIVIGFVIITFSVASDYDTADDSTTNSTSTA